MEVNNQQEGESHSRVPGTKSEALSLELIRTETVLSRLPVHNLAKQGRVNIQIIKTTPSGEVELKWEVSYSERYGQARQLAYKLDTIIVNQRIDEAGRPLPKLLRIGSLNEICAELNLATHAGQNAKDLKKAFLQNASAFITAKFNYRANDGTERHVEAGVTRYGVIFTGEKLPDGRKADAVYISFNDPFWEVLNNAPVRPLDRAYMKTLPPAAQRFYEIISRKIFAALKNDYARAKISYSEYCTFSAQLRHFERQRVQDQMAKVLRPHKASGYITAIKYEPIIDAQNQPDWILYLTPGPKARAEFAAAHTRRKVLKPGIATAYETGESEPKHHRSVRQAEPENDLTTPPAKFDPALVAEFTRRGITQEKAIQLVANRKPGQDVIAQLEITDQMIEHAGFKIVNPPGFYIRQIERNLSVPDTFETSAKRRAREEAERKQQARRVAEDARDLLRFEYDHYCDAETERYIETHPDLFEEIKDAKLQEEISNPRGLSFDSSELVASRRAKWEIREQAPLLTFDEFLAHKKQGTDFFLKPVGPSQTPEPTGSLPETQEDAGDIDAVPADYGSSTVARAEPPIESLPKMAPEPMIVGPEHTGTDQDPPAPALRPDSDIQPLEAEEEAAQRAASKLELVPDVPLPMVIELASDPPPNDLGGMAAEQGIA